jgi:hypothetical protein
MNENASNPSHRTTSNVKSAGVQGASGDDAASMRANIISSPLQKGGGNGPSPAPCQLSQLKIEKEQGKPDVDRDAPQLLSRWIECCEESSLSVQLKTILLCMQIALGVMWFHPPVVTCMAEHVMMCRMFSVSVAGCRMEMIIGKSCMPIHQCLVAKSFS